MTIEAFKAYVKTGKPLDTEEIHQLMYEMSEEARRVTFQLNSAYHTADEVRELLSELFGYQVPRSFRVFPPFLCGFWKEHHGGRGCIHQCLLPLSGSWRSDPWRWMPDWA